MKRLIAFILVVTMVIMVMPIPVLAGNTEELIDDESIIVWENGETTVYVDGEETEWEDPPLTRDDFTMVPFKIAVEVFGGEFGYWDSDTGSAYGELDGDELKYTMDTEKYWVNGKKRTARRESEIIDGRLYVDVKTLTKITKQKVDYMDGYVFISESWLSEEEKQRVIDYLYYGIDEYEITLKDIKAGKVYAVGEEGKHIYKRVYDSRKATKYTDTYLCTIQNIKLPANTVLIQDGNYLYLNGEEELAKISTLKEVDERISQLNKIIDGAWNAYNNGTINSKRRNTIIKKAEATIEEYEEVAKGEKKLNRVNERKKDYVAKEGNKNETVEEIQQRLFDFGYTSQKVTSYYGSITFNNIAYFQIINDLAVTGWVDDETYDLLYEVEETIVPEIVELEDLEWEELEKTEETDYLISSLKQVAFGNFTDDVTVLGTVAQVGMGLAGIDVVADVRDIIADVVNWQWAWSNAGQTVIDVIALVPIIGGIKYFDEAAVLVKNSDEILLVTKHADEVGDIISQVSKIPDKGFSNFDKLKNYLGKADTGHAWHHIVEQSQIDKAGFAPEQIHNLRNIVQIPSGYSGSIHAQITARYNSIQNFTNGKTLRNWLATKSFDEQFEFGLDVLKEYGTITVTEAGWIFKPFN